MTPKKKNPYAPLINFGIIAVAIYISAQLAASVKYAELNNVGQSDFYMTVLNYFSDVVTNNPFHFVICEYTGKYVMYGGIGTAVVLLAIANSKKNYIHGKEFGTAKWGGVSDIKDLFAKTIMDEEIKRAKEVKNWWGRWKARQKIYDSINKEQKKELQRLIANAKIREEERKERGEGNKKLLAEEIAKLNKEMAEETAKRKAEAWKPNGLLADYKERIKEIDASPMYTGKKEREAAKKKAKADYEAQLKDFYNGTSRIKKIREKYTDADMLFTKTERISMYNFKLNNNTLILGGSGSGKTRGFVMPNILQAHSSYVVTDPKGEILEKAGHFLKEVKGYKIRVLNLDNKAASDGYNPFVYLRQDREGFEENVLSLIEAIITNTDGGEKKGGSDPFWDKAERLFLQALFFFTAVAFKPKDRNMNTVLALIGMLEIGEEEDNQNSDLDVFAKHFERDFGKDHIGAQQYREFRSKASGKTAKSIVISAVARLAPFRTQAVRRIFSYDSMHLDRLGEEKTAIFVVVPPTDTTFNFIAGMVFTQMFQELQYCATQVHKHDGQRLPVPCRFILDEFANTCKIPNFVQILAYARSFGIGIVPILQSLEQIKNMYKDEWGVIVDNCNTLLYLGSITHMDTLEYMSKLLGKGTFDKRTTGRTRGRQGSSSENFDVIGRELMDASEIRKLPKQNCLFIVGGRNPFYSEKYDYPSHPNYQFTSDANHLLSFEYVPEKPPEETAGGTGTAATAEQKKAVAELKPSDRTKVVTETLETNTDAQESVTNIVNGESKPITDEMTKVHDGENTDYSAFLADVIAEDEAASRGQSAGGTEAASNFYETVAGMSEETSRKMEDFKKSELISFEILTVASMQKLIPMVRRGEIKPLEDEKTVVNDGEEKEELEAEAAEEISEAVTETAAEAEPTTEPAAEELPHGEEAEGTEDTSEAAKPNEAVNENDFVFDFEGTAEELENVLNQSEPNEIMFNQLKTIVSDGFNVEPTPESEKIAS